jgi:curved DNA-binding protein CbpA
LRGTLSEGVLPGVLRDLYVERKSGLLHFIQASGQRSVRFRKGHIVHAVSTEPTEHLSGTLVRSGRLTPTQLAEASELVTRDNKRMGAALIELGYLDRPGLEDALAAHAREILLRVFASHEGEYFFEETDVRAAAGDEVTLRLSTGEMILEAVRLMKDPAAVLHGLGDVGRIVGPASDPLLRFQKLALSPTDAFLLSRIDGTLTAEEVVEIAPVEADEARRSLLGLLCTGMVQYRLDKPKPTKRFPTVRKRLATMRFAVKDIASAVRGADGITAPTSAARSEPPKVEPPRTAPPSASPATPPPAPAAPGPAEPPRPAVPPKPAPAAEEATRQAAERRAEILDVHANLRTRNHFEILGIPRASRDSEVKEAYFRLARRFHPDTHHDASLHDLAEQIEAIFIRIGEAYDTLRNPKTRAAYEERLGPSRSAPPRATPPAPAPGAPGAGPANAAAATPAPGGPAAAPPAAAPAAAPTLPLGEALRQGEMRFAEEKYYDVIRLIEPYLEATKGKGLQKVRLLLARAYAKNPNRVKRAEEELQKVVRDEPGNAEAYMQLGGIYKRGGLKARATAMFRKALELDTDNHDAERELHALGPSEPTPPPDKGGLLKKLFGKS